VAPTTASNEVAQRLGVTQHRLGDVCVIEVVGELDLWTAPALCTWIADAGERVLIDVSRLQMCDSTGLRALSRAVRERRIECARVQVLAPTLSGPARAFEAAGTGAALPLAGDLDEALARLNG